MKHWLGLIATVLLGCSGSVETSPGPDGASSSGSSASAGTGGLDPCAVPEEAFDSNVAIARIRCAFPAYTKQEVLRSAGGGDLDPLGRSTSWAFRVRDDASNLTMAGSVAASQGVVPNGPAPTKSYCAGQETIPLDSAIVVPDAIQRFAKHDPYVGGYTNYFLVQASPCPSFNSIGFANVMISRPSTPDGAPDGMPHYWYAHYDAVSKFVKLCGPCGPAYSSNDDDEHCTTCFD